MQKALYAVCTPQCISAIWTPNLFKDNERAKRLQIIHPVYLRTHPQTKERTTKTTFSPMHRPIAECLSISPLIVPETEGCAPEIISSKKDIVAHIPVNLTG